MDAYECPGRVDAATRRERVAEAHTAGPAVKGSA